MKADYCLALDIGATNIKFAIVSQDMQLEDFNLVPTDRSLGPMGLVDQLCDIYRAQTASFNSKTNKNIPVGISCAGPLDPVDGRLLIPANLTGEGADWSNFPLAQKLSDKLGVKVRLENDAAAAALGELWMGKGRGVKDFMILVLGTGLGVAAVRNGEVVRAAGGLHTELSHSIINFDENPPLPEVRIQGSLESYLGPKFFLLRFSAIRGRITSGEEFIELVKSKDVLALRWAESYKQILLSAMFNFYLCFAPELYVFQGGFSPLIEILKPDLETIFSQRITGFTHPQNPPPKIEISELSRTGGVFGAAYRVFF